MIKKTLILFFLFCAGNSIAQNKTINFIEILDKVCKNENKYYAAIPVWEGEKYFIHFLRFASTSVEYETKIFLGPNDLVYYCKRIVGKGYESWFVDDKFMYIIHTFDKKNIEKNFSACVYYSLSSIFSNKEILLKHGELLFSKSSFLPVIKEWWEEKPFGKIPLYDDWEKGRMETNRFTHTWYDMVNFNDSLTIYASASDTVLMIKDMAMKSNPHADYVIRGQIYIFPYLKEFKIFKIKSNDYLLNDRGELFIIPKEESKYIDRGDIKDIIREDRRPLQVGYFQYEKEKNPFCLIDNDSGQVYFNCPFIPSSKEYEGLVGYIDSKHWLYKQYNEIKERYSEKK